MGNVVLAKGVNKDTVQLLYDRVIYPNMELLFVANGKVVYGNSVKEGLICVTNCSIIVYQPKKWQNREKAYDYNLTQIKNYSYNRSWLSSEIVIHMTNSHNIILKGIRKGEEEQRIDFLKKLWSNRIISYKSRGQTDFFLMVLLGLLNGDQEKMPNNGLNNI